MHAVVGRCIFKPVNQIFILCDRDGRSIRLQRRSGEGLAFNIAFAHGLVRALMVDNLGTRPIAVDGVELSMTLLGTRSTYGEALGQRTVVGTGDTWSLFPGTGPKAEAKAKVDSRKFETENPDEDALWRRLESLQSVKERKTIMDRIARLRRHSETHRKASHRRVAKSPASTSPGSAPGVDLEDDPKAFEHEWGIPEDDRAWPDVDALLAGGAIENPSGHGGAGSSGAGSAGSASGSGSSASAAAGAGVVAENFIWKSHIKFSYKERIDKKMTMDAWEVQCPFHSQPGLKTSCTRTESFVNNLPGHSEMTLRRLKAWVIAGQNIVPWGDDSRAMHKAEPIPPMSEVPSTEELEAWEMPDIPEHLLRKRRRLYTAGPQGGAS